MLLSRVPAPSTSRQNSEQTGRSCSEVAQHSFRTPCHAAPLGSNPSGPTRVFPSAVFESADPSVFLVSSGWRRPLRALAKDRDIRELMGARDLYIAEVFDVAKTGVTKKPTAGCSTRKRSLWSFSPTIWINKPEFGMRARFKPGDAAVRTSRSL